MRSLAFVFGAVTMLGGAALLTTTTIARAAPPSPQPQESSDERRMMAQALMEQGLKAADSDPKGALGALRSSYETQPDFKVLYHVAKVCSRMKDTPCAVAAYEQYLREGGSDISSKRKKEVERELKALSKTIGSLTIKSSAKNADVRVDGVLVGKTPLAQPITLGIGAHRVALNNHNDVEKSFQVTSGENTNVEIDLPPEKPEKAEKPEEVAPPAPAPVLATPRASSAITLHSQTSARTPVLPWIITGALAAGTGASAYFMVKANDRYNAVKGTYPITRQELDDAHDGAQNLLYLTGGLGIATLVSLGVSGYFTFIKKSDVPTGADKMVGVAVGPNGVSITGRMP